MQNQDGQNNIALIVEKQIILQQIMGIYKCVYHRCRHISSSWRPLSIRRRHSHTYHIGGAVVSECARATGSVIQ